MKFMAIFVMLAAFVATSWALKHEDCGLPHSSNGDGVYSCHAAFSSWSFDAGSNECVKFTYGGCFGNANRFGTKQACEAKCKV